MIGEPTELEETESLEARRHVSTIASALSPLVGETWLPWPYLLAMEAALEKELARPGGGRLIINAPPRHGKSLFTSHWLPVWYLECCPHLNVVLASYEARVAARWGRKVRDTFQRPELWTKVRQGRANRDGDPSSSSAVDWWESADGGGMRSCGAGGPLTGTGFHLGIIDDPIKNWEEACSVTRRKNLQDWFQSTFYTRCEPNATIVVNMTRWHEDDLTGWLLREHASDNWTHLSLPAIAEENDPIGRDVGQPLCPERYSVEQLKRIGEAVGQTKWLGLFQQRPAPGGGRIIRADWCEKRFSVLPSNASHTCISVDASFKAGEKNSRVCIQAWARTRAEFFLLDQVCRPMEFAETLDEVELMIRKWPGCRARYIEDKANGPAIISMLRKKVPGLIPVEPLGSKEARLQAVSPLFQSGSVILPDEIRAPWVADYVSELTSFPSAPFDDQVDATSQALLKMTERDASAGGGFGGSVPH